MTTKELGQRIQVGRMSRGLTQADLANQLGVATSTVGMWEIGRREPSIETLEAISDIYNVPLSYFLCDDPDHAVNISPADADRLEAIHQNPKLGLLFDRQRKMSEADVEIMLTLADRILAERTSK